MANNPRKRKRRVRPRATARARPRRRRNAVVVHANPLRAYRRRSGAKRRNMPHRYRRRRNPAGVGDVRALGTRALYAIGGGIATRSLPQMILKEKNEGVFGYLANGVALIVSSFAANYVGGRMARDAAALGGMVMIAGRVVEDILGRRLVEFTGAPELLGNYGDSRYDLGLGGEYVSSYFSVPTISDQKLMTASPVPTVEAVQQATNMSSLGRYGNRYGSRYAN